MIHTHKGSSIYTHTHTYIHTYMHIHRHTYTPASVSMYGRVTGTVVAFRRLVRLGTVPQLVRALQVAGADMGVLGTHGGGGRVSGQD
jgi:hypothetical protein